MCYGDQSYRWSTGDKLQKEGNFGLTIISLHLYYIEFNNLNIVLAVTGQMSFIILVVMVKT